MPRLLLVGDKGLELYCATATFGFAKCEGGQTWKTQTATGSFRLSVRVL